MGDSTFAHPYCQAFALPLPKDKQRSQPTPDDYIRMYARTLYIIKARAAGYTINPNADVSLHYLCRKIKVAKFDSTDDNVRKRLFEVRSTTAKTSFPRC